MPALGYRHQRVQRLRRLAGRRSARVEEGVFVVEGAKVLAEALAAGAVESVYLDPAGAGPPELDLAQRCLAAGGRVFELDKGVLERVTDTVTPQPILGVAVDPSVPLAALESPPPTLVVVCAEVRDPGNAGTVLRSAAAAGADAVVACDGSVDLLNPKTVRASAGAVFRVPVVNGGDPAGILGTLGAWGLRRLGAAAQGGTDYADADLRSPIAVVLGNEARGLPAGASARLDGNVTIPMGPGAESLNVGIAAAVLCFEAARQRRRPAP
ncbi:MAG: TrmH family RNA methyltransferase [Acidimicrobiales bacterium]